MLAAASALAAGHPDGRALLDDALAVHERRFWRGDLLPTGLRPCRRAKFHGPGGSVAWSGVGPASAHSNLRLVEICGGSDELGDVADREPSGHAATMTYGLAPTTGR
jgi:hypothetical protein